MKTIAVLTSSLLIILLLIIHSITLAATNKNDLPSAYTASVVKIFDGDTILVRELGTAHSTPQRFYRVRLAGIDAPELDQPYGAEARTALTAVLKHRTVEVRPLTTDIYDRQVAHIRTSANADICAFMLETGYAWHYKAFDKSTYYARLEAAAQANKMGLWQSATTPVPPWEWRRKTFHS